MNTKNQLEDAEIGDIAIVRCVTINTYSQAKEDCKIYHNIPILPFPPHSDRDVIGFAPLHYHFDYRYFDHAVLQEMLDPECYYDPEDWTSRIQLAEEVIGKPYDSELICVHDMPIANPGYDFLARLEDHFEEARLINGHFCPHQGYKVFAVPQDDTKNRAVCALACPGHSLVFGSNGKMIRRSKRLEDREYGMMDD